MIRVLHSVSNMDRAGIETMVMNFYRHMDRSQVQFDFWANKKKVGAYEDEIREMGGRVFRGPGFYPTKYPAYVRELKALLNDDPELQIVHVHNGSLGAYMLMAAKLCGVENRLYHAHGTRLPEGRGRWAKRLIKPMIDPLATKKLACGTDAARFYYSKKTYEAHDFTLIHNAIELDRFAFTPQTRERIRREYQLDDRVVIGHIGRFSAQKNHARLVQIFAAVRRQIPTAALLLIGEGETKEQIARQAREMGLEKDVHLIPPVSDPYNWYQAMDAFLLPSIWEGLPVVAIEAQAAGLPCILSSAVTKEARVTDRVRFVGLEQEDQVWAREIQEALRGQYDRTNTRQALQAAGYDIVSEAKKLQDLYLELAKGR